MNESIVSMAIDAIISREGGYIDHPADRGGPTKHGITQATLAAFRGCPVTAEDVRAIYRDEAEEIYRWRYVYGPKFDQIPDPALFEVVVDAAVHSGPRIATKWLQAAVGVDADGVIGPVTRAAMDEIFDSDDTLAWRRVRARFIAQRVRYLGRIVTDRPDNAVFAAGWMARAAKFIEAL